MRTAGQNKEEPEGSGSVRTDPYGRTEELANFRPRCSSCSAGHAADSADDESASSSAFSSGEANVETLVARQASTDDITDCAGDESESQASARIGNLEAGTPTSDDGCVNDGADLMGNRDGEDAIKHQ